MHNSSRHLLGISGRCCNHSSIFSFMCYSISLSRVQSGRSINQERNCELCASSLHTNGLHLVLAGKAPVTHMQAQLWGGGNMRDSEWPSATVFSNTVMNMKSICYVLSERVIVLLELAKSHKHCLSWTLLGWTVLQSVHAHTISTVLTFTNYIYVILILILNT